MQKKGTIFIISSPSGGGKTTVANAIIKKNQNIKRSISFTTRTPRLRERDEHDYFFIKEQEFFKKAEENLMLEYAKVFINYYGTSKEYVESVIENGTNIICCIDWQGAKQIVEKMEAITIFLLPPTMKELEKRLKKRGTEESDIVENRLKIARDEIQKCQTYNYVLINDNLEETIDAVNTIISGQRYQSSQDKESIERHINNLLAEGWN